MARHGSARSTVAGVLSRWPGRRAIFVERLITMFILIVSGRSVYDK
jgi:low affinity Fe/Cu permease